VRKTLTVIFDRSAFHGADFDRLAGSRLLEFVRSDKIRVHHTQMFLEETLGLYERERNRAVFRRQLPFILDICNGKWLRSREEIWRMEVVQGKGKNSNVFESLEARTNTERRLREAVAGDADLPEFWEALPEKHAERQKQARQFTSWKDLRKEVDEIRRGIVSPADKIPETPKEFIARHLVLVGKGLITRQVAAPDPLALCAHWRKDKRNFPFFTSFVEGYLYAGYYAMIEVNEPVDWNAQADIEQLTGLIKADLLVSCDTRFQRLAFDVLWAGRGRRMMTTSEFVDRLPELVDVPAPN
jgi:hypothetical protein